MPREIGLQTINHISWEKYNYMHQQFARMHSTYVITHWKKKKVDVTFSSLVLSHLKSRLLFSPTKTSLLQLCLKKSSSWYVPLRETRNSKLYVSSYIFQAVVYCLWGEGNSRLHSSGSNPRSSSHSKGDSTHT